MIAILSFLPAAAFSTAAAMHLFSTRRGRTLPAELGLGPAAQKFAVIILMATIFFLAMPEFRVAGVVIASLLLSVVAVTMLWQSKYDYAIPALLVIATLPLALAAPQLP
jgi:hypothetical protein